MSLKDSRAIYLGTLRIPASNNSSLDATESTLDPGATPSSPNVRKYIPSFEFAKFAAISIAGPASLDQTINLRFLTHHQADETNDANYNTAQSPPGTDITIAAGKTITLQDLATAAIALTTSTGNETANRDFHVYGSPF